MSSAHRPHRFRQNASTRRRFRPTFEQLENRINPAFFFLTDPTDGNVTADAVAENAGAGTVVGVTAASFDPAGGTVTYSLAYDAAGRFQIDAGTGIVSVAPGAVIDFESSGGFYPIQIRATDGSLTFNDLPFAIAVTNLAPSSLTDGDLTPELVSENAGAGTVVGFTAVATDPAGGTVTYALTDDAGGRFQIDVGTGVVTVAPGAVIDFETSGGSYAVAVRATDGNLNSSDTTASITVSDLNDAPVLLGANNFTGITEDATTNSGELVSALGNISDADSGAVQGIALTSIVSSTGTWEYSRNGGSTWSAVGTVSTSTALLLTSTDRLRFVPDGANGTAASVTFLAWDQTTGTAGTTANAGTTGGATAFSTASATASITASDVNDVPTAVGPALIHVNHGQAVTGIAPLVGSSDADGDPLWVSTEAYPTKGSLSWTGATYTYTAYVNCTGADSFQFALHDNYGGVSAPAMVYFVIDNSAPGAADQVFAVAAGATQANIDPLLGSSDDEGDALTVATVTDPTQGSLNWNGSTYTYIANSGATGIDFFQFQLFDGAASSNVATVFININAGTVADSTDQDTAKIVTVFSALDPNESYTFTIFAPSAWGSVTSNYDGTFTFDPRTDFKRLAAGITEDATFACKATDIQGASTFVLVTVTVTGLNDAPWVANGVAFEVPDSQPLTDIDFTALSSDVDRDPLTLTVTQPDHGTLTPISGTNKYQYVPQAGYVGLAMATFRANDGVVDSDVAAITFFCQVAAPALPAPPGNAPLTGRLRDRIDGALDRGLNLGRSTPAQGDFLTMRRRLKDEFVAGGGANLMTGATGNYTLTRDQMLAEFNITPAFLDRNVQRVTAAIPGANVTVTYYMRVGWTLSNALPNPNNGTLREFRLTFILLMDVSYPVDATTTIGHRFSLHSRRLEDPMTIDLSMAY